MEEICSMNNCGNTTANSADSFYPFPTDFKLCMSWVQHCGRPEYFEDFSYQGCCPFIKRKLCSRHFKVMDFVDPSDKTLGLKEKAIPVPLIQKLIQDGSPLKHQDLNDEGRTRNCLGIKQEPELTDDDCSNISDELLKAVDAQLAGLKHKNLTDSELIEEQAKIRRQKNALRAALKRRAETAEQRAERKHKDIIRSAKRRQSETELQRQIRRYNDAVRAAYRRSNETEEQRQRRRMVDIIRAARRRQSETPEQRQARLKADRERAARRRLLKKMAESGSELSSDSFTSNVNINIPLIEPQVNLTENVVHHFSSVSDNTNILKRDSEKGGAVDRFAS